MNVGELVFCICCVSGIIFLSDTNIDAYRKIGDLNNRKNIIQAYICRIISQSNYSWEKLQLMIN